MRTLLNWLKYLALGLFTLVFVLGLLGLTYQAVASKSDEKNFPPPGVLVNVDGYNMHIYCMGEGSPTIILDHVGGGSSMDWTLIQPKLAEHTRVCAYDRAGYGWSDYNPAPRTLAQQVKELHGLLEGANEQGPYILVAHSYGARVARVYTATYPQEVLGMVLMDPGKLYDDPRYSQETLTEFQSENSMIRTINRLSPFGLVRLLRPIMMSAPVYDLPEKAVRANDAFAVTNRYWKSMKAQTDLLPAIFDEEHHVTSLGNIPLLVLNSTEPDNTDQQVYIQANTEMSELSTNGRLQTVQGATHMSLAYRKNNAQVCTDGILSILDAVRTKVIR